MQTLDLSKPIPEDQLCRWQLNRLTAEYKTTGVEVIPVDVFAGFMEMARFMAASPRR